MSIDMRHIIRQEISRNQKMFSKIHRQKQNLNLNLNLKQNNSKQNNSKQNNLREPTSNLRLICPESSAVLYSTIPERDIITNQMILSNLNNNNNFNNNNINIINKGRGILKKRSSEISYHYADLENKFSSEYSEWCYQMKTGTNFHYWEEGKIIFMPMGRPANISLDVWFFQKKDRDILKKRPITRPITNIQSPFTKNKNKKSHLFLSIDGNNKINENIINDINRHEDREMKEGDIENSMKLEIEVCGRSDPSFAIRRSVQIGDTGRIIIINEDKHTLFWQYIFIARVSKLRNLFDNIRLILYGHRFMFRLFSRQEGFQTSINKIFYHHIDIKRGKIIRENENPITKIKIKSVHSRLEVGGEVHFVTNNKLSIELIINEMWKCKDLFVSEYPFPFYGSVPNGSSNLPENSPVTLKKVYPKGFPRPFVTELREDKKSILDRANIRIIEKFLINENIPKIEMELKRGNNSNNIIPDINQYNDIIENPVKLINSGNYTYHTLWVKKLDERVNSLWDGGILPGRILHELMN